MHLLADGIPLYISFISSINIDTARRCQRSARNNEQTGRAYPSWVMVDISNRQQCDPRRTKRKSRYNIREPMSAEVQARESDQSDEDRGAHDERYAPRKPEFTSDQDNEKAVHGGVHRRMAAWK